MSEVFSKMLSKVAGGWEREKKAREASAGRPVEDADVKPMKFKAAAYAVMEEAYMKASANGTLPAHARQIMYAARPLVMKLTEGKIWSDSDYFTQDILSDYLEERGGDPLSDLLGDTELGGRWNIVFDARGNLHEPHTGLTVPLGTLKVNDYLNGIIEQEMYPPTAQVDPFSVNHMVSTCGPDHRYSGLLFIEKEGFIPLFQAAKIAERYDVAIMSTKGMSVVASRLLIDTVCGKYGVPLLVLHDFDKAGFSITATLQHDTSRYTFQNQFKVVDLGLRLDDIAEYELESEDVSYGKEDPTDNLRKNGATDDEISFLYEGQDDMRKGHGRRVELNAFTSDMFIKWLESKLIANGITKVIPDDTTIVNAFRRGVAIEHINAGADSLRKAGEACAQSTRVPADLKARVTTLLQENPELPWDTAIQRVAHESYQNINLGGNGQS